MLIKLTFSHRISFNRYSDICFDVYPQVDQLKAKSDSKYGKRWHFWYFGHRSSSRISKEK
jgi:hypothetical protein